jgi:hypothetical protein
MLHVPRPGASRGTPIQAQAVPARSERLTGAPAAALRPSGTATAPAEHEAARARAPRPCTSASRSSTRARPPRPPRTRAPSCSRWCRAPSRTGSSGSKPKAASSGTRHQARAGTAPRPPRARSRAAASRPPRRSPRAPVPRTGGSGNRLEPAPPTTVAAPSAVRITVRPTDAGARRLRDRAPPSDERLEVRVERAQLELPAGPPAAAAPSWPRWARRSPRPPRRSPSACACRCRGTAPHPARRRCARAARSSSRSTPAA